MWARLRLPAGTQDDMPGHDRAGRSRNSGHSVTLLGSSPNPKFAGKKEAVQHKLWQVDFYGQWQGVLAFSSM